MPPGTSEKISTTMVTTTATQAMKNRASFTSRTQGILRRGSR